MFMTFKMATHQTDYARTGGESITLADIHDRALRDVRVASTLGGGYQNFLDLLGEIYSGLGLQERLDQHREDAIPYTFFGTIAEWTLTQNFENNQPADNYIVVLMQLRD